MCCFSTKLHRSTIIVLIYCYSVLFCSIPFLSIYLSTYYLTYLSCICELVQHTRRALLRNLQNSDFYAE